MQSQIMLSPIVLILHFPPLYNHLHTQMGTHLNKYGALVSTFSINTFQIIQALLSAYVFLHMS